MWCVNAPSILCGVRNRCDGAERPGGSCTLGGEHYCGGTDVGLGLGRGIGGIRGSGGTAEVSLGLPPVNLRHIVGIDRDLARRTFPGTSHRLLLIPGGGRHNLTETHPTDAGRQRSNRHRSASQWWSIYEFFSYID